MHTAQAGRTEIRMKKIGFLSFGHWSDTRGSGTRSASDVLLQSIELAVAAEEAGHSITVETQGSAPA